MVAGHLSDALAAPGVPAETVTEIIGAVAPLAPEIATGEGDKPPSDRSAGIAMTGVSRGAHGA